MSTETRLTLLVPAGARGSLCQGSKSLLLHAPGNFFQGLTLWPLSASAISPFHYVDRKRKEVACRHPSSAIPDGVFLFGSSPGLDINLLVLNILDLLCYGSQNRNLVWAPLTRALQSGKVSQRPSALLVVKPAEPVLFNIPLDSTTLSGIAPSKSPTRNWAAGVKYAHVESPFPPRTLASLFGWIQITTPSHTTHSTIPFSVPRLTQALSRIHCSANTRPLHHPASFLLNVLLVYPSLKPLPPTPISAFFTLRILGTRLLRYG